MSNFCKLGATFRPRHRERFRRLVRKLNYLTVTCPNIYFTVSLVSQFLKFPYKGHCYAVFYILKYIKDTPRKGLLHEDKGHTQIVGYADANWADSLTNLSNFSQIRRRHF